MWQGERRKGLFALVMDMDLQRSVRVHDLLVDSGKSKRNTVRGMDRVDQPLVARAKPLLQAK